MANEEERTLAVLERLAHAIDGGKWNPGVRDSLEHLTSIEQHPGRTRVARQPPANRRP